jgi:hypothetical protein
MTEHDTPTTEQPAETSGEKEKLNRSLFMRQLAGELGYDEEAPDPQSVLDILVATGRLSGDDYVPAFNRAHELKILSDNASSHTADCLRSLLEIAGPSDGDTSLHELAKELAGDISADTVASQWDDIVALYGIREATTINSLAVDRALIGDSAKGRQDQHADFIGSGDTRFVTHGGAWGAGMTW